MKVFFYLASLAVAGISAVLNIFAVAPAVVSAVSNVHVIAGVMTLAGVLVGLAFADVSDVADILAVARVPCYRCRSPCHSTCRS